MTPRTGLGASMAVLAVVAVAGIWLPGWTYLPVNLAAGAGLLEIARRCGATADDLGLRSDRLRRGLAVGTLVGLAAAAAIGITAAVPAAQHFFDDQRAAGIGMTGLLYQLLLRIPVGTALFEEVAFRGVLLGLGRRSFKARTGTGTAAVVFGLWHIPPAITFADANATAGNLAVGAVVALAVVSTAIAGLVFTVLRDRSGSLAAPVLFHMATNTTAFAAAWALLRNA